MHHSRLLLLSALVFATQAFAVLKKEDLVDFTWRLSNEAGPLNWMTFLTDGKVGVGLSSDLALWTLTTNNVLILSGTTKSPTVYFAWAFQDFYGKWRLQGKLLNFALKGVASGTTIYLEQMI